MVYFDTLITFLKKNWKPLMILGFDLIGLHLPRLFQLRRKSFSHKMKIKFEACFGKTTS